ncbi:hypothetical protein BH24ACT16_BH24ACT16_17810 [soil metagenome]|jgi:hypothetical protein
MPEPAEIPGVILAGLEKTYGPGVAAEIFAGEDDSRLIAVRFTDGDRYTIRLERAPDSDVAES